MLKTQNLKNQSHNNQRPNRNNKKLSYSIPFNSRNTRCNNLEITNTQYNIIK